MGGSTPKWQKWHRGRAAQPPAGTGLPSRGRPDPSVPSCGRSVDCQVMCSLLKINIPYGSGEAVDFVVEFMTIGLHLLKQGVELLADGVAVVGLRHGEKRSGVF